MRIPVLAGRDFNAGDNEKAAGAVIINRSTAKRHWPDGQAIGRKLRLGSGAQAPWLTIVGVVADVRYREWEAARPDFYVPYLQRAQHRTDFVVRTSGNPWALASAVRQAVFESDKNQPVSNLDTMEDLVGKALARARLAAYLMETLAFSATVLAAIGIYGLVAYLVRQRTHEIAVRTALGARPIEAAGLASFWVLRFVAAGLMAGTIGGAAAAKAWRSQLFEVSPFEPSVYLLMAAALSLIAMIAAGAPAWRASSMDPAAALRGSG
jgi:putative ABC transport system permease protein